MCFEGEVGCFELKFQTGRGVAHQPLLVPENLENVAIIAMYCHLRPPDAIAFPT